MSTQTMERPENAGAGTRPIREHEWLQQLVGEWRVETEMFMGPGEPMQRAQATENIRSFGGLWAFGEGKTTTPDGSEMSYYAALGYDVTLKQYRGCWIASVSSHLWVKQGSLSADGRTLTLIGDGPDMLRNEGMTKYKDVFEFQDQDHFTMTHYGQNSQSGQWQEFMKARYTRR